MYYIYKIVNLVNGKKYFGQTKYKNARWYKHKYDARNDQDTVICRAIRRYGEENFEYTVIQEWNTQEEVDKAESWWIKEFRTHDPKIGYNVRLGGESTSYREEYCREQSERMKQYYSDPSHPRGGPKVGHKFGPHSEERKEKARQGLLKYFQENPEAKAAITERQKGKTLNPNARRDPKTGRYLKKGFDGVSVVPDGEIFKLPPRSEEHCQNLSESMKASYAEGRKKSQKGISRTEEVKEKCSEANIAWYAENEYPEERREKIRQKTIEQFSTEESRKKHSGVTKAGMKKYFEENPDKLEAHKERCRKALAALRDPVTGRIKKQELPQAA